MRPRVHGAILRLFSMPIVVLGNVHDSVGAYYESGWVGLERELWVVKEVTHHVPIF